MFEKVLKFGGAALADGPLVLRSCEIVRRWGGARPVVVVSAHLGVTDLLDTVAGSAAAGILEGDRVRIRHRSLLRQLGLDSELLDRHFSEFFHLLGGIKARGRLEPEERDLILSFGERMSARVVAHALRAQGVLATPVDAFDLGLTSDSNHGNAEPLPESFESLRAALEQVSGIPVVTGFLAKDRHGNLTTLGRNGSDLTAALIGEALGAQELQLWKAVGGFMSADPKLVPDARVIERLGFAEAAEYAFHGAEVLHAAALAPAERAGMLVRLLDVNDPEANGTLLEPRCLDAGPVGIAARRRVTRISLALGPSADRARTLAELFGTLARARVDVGPLSHTAERAALVCTPSNGLDQALVELGRRVNVEHEYALAAVIGRANGSDNELVRRALQCLAEAQVEVVEAFVGSRSASQAFLVRAHELERAVRALHAGLLRKNASPPLAARA